MKYLFMISFIIPLMSYAQIDRDSLFNSERTMDRRFSLYKGQLRMEGGYFFNVFRSEFNANGYKTKLSENGVSTNLHTVATSFRYGIINYIDAELKLTYKKKNYRGEPIYIVGAPEPPQQLNTDIVTSGFEDIYLGLNAIAPFASNRLDLGGSIGLFLPSANSEPNQPEHSFSSDGTFDNINYYFKENWGYGVASVYYKLFLKYRFKKVAFSGGYAARVPNDVSQSVIWSSRLNDSNSFDYTSTPYQHQIPFKNKFNLQFEYQLFDWVNVFADYSNLKSKKGWSEETGVKIALPEEKLALLKLGYEILVSNKLWLRQGIDLPLSGENSEAPFSIQTTFYYNLFMN